MLPWDQMQAALVELNAAKEAELKKIRDEKKAKEEEEKLRLGVNTLKARDPTIKMVNMENAKDQSEEDKEIVRFLEACNLGDLESQKPDKDTVSSHADERRSYETVHRCCSACTVYAPLLLCMHCIRTAAALWRHIYMHCIWWSPMLLAQCAVRRVRCGVSCDRVRCDRVRYVLCAACCVLQVLKYIEEKKIKVRIECEKAEMPLHKIARVKVDNNNKGEHEAHAAPARSQRDPYVPHSIISPLLPSPSCPRRPVAAVSSPRRSVREGIRRHHPKEPRGGQGGRAQIHLQ